jgi:predicted amidohydrolase
MLMNTFKISIIQFAPSFGNPDQTIATLMPFMGKVGQAALVVLPELANSGYNFRDSTEAFQFSEIPDKSNFVGFLIAQCRKFDYSVVTGFNERCGNKIYNSALLINKNGIAGKYRKIQLFMNEKDYFTPGNKKPEIYDVDGAKIGMLVCFDWVFPELWGSLARNGADVICHPSNLVLPGKAQRAIPAWAMTNRIFIATANRTGTERGLTFTGNSIIASPSGDLPASASADQEEIISADCDLSLARDKMITPKNHLFHDRRPEMYYF